MDIRDQYPRTVCGCKRCVLACVHKPGMLIPGDLERIYDSLKVQPEFDNWLLEHFLASQGAVIMSQGKLYRIPTIVPNRVTEGCVFLRNNLCSVHSVAPFGCSHFDLHMSGEDGEKRSKAALAAIAYDFSINGSYAQAFRKLVDAERFAPDIGVRQQALRNAIEAL